MTGGQQIAQITLFSNPVQKGSRSEKIKEPARGFQSVFSKSMHQYQDQREAKNQKLQQKTTISMQKTKQIDRKQDGKKPEDQTELINQCYSLTEDIREKVKTAMEDLGEEELEACLEALGLQWIDLLQPENLKQFLLQANGLQDVTDLLTNEVGKDQFLTLLKQLDELTSMVPLEADEAKQILTELDGTTMQQFQEMGQVSKTDMEQKEALSPEGEREGNNYLEEGKITVFAEDNDTIKQSQNHEAFQEDVTTGNEKQQKQEKVEVHKEKDVLEQFIGQMERTVSLEEEPVFEVKQEKQILEQLVKQIKISVKVDQTSMELQLRPESLGKVHLLVQEKSGVLTAQFSVESAAAKDAIQSQLQLLKDTLQNQGLKVDAVEVTISDFTFTQKQDMDGQREQARQQEKQSRTQIRDLEEMPIEEAESVDELLQWNGSTVSYQV